MRIEVDKLILTNPFVDEQDVYIRQMVSDLREGKIKPSDLTIPFVTWVEGQGWCVNDGNNTIKALQMAGIKYIEVDTY